MEGWDIYISTCPRPSFYLAWACTSTSPLRDLGSLPLRLVVTPPFLFPSSVPFLPRRSSLRAPSLRFSPSFSSSLPPSFPSFALRPRAIRGLEQWVGYYWGETRRTTSSPSLCRHATVQCSELLHSPFYFMQTVHTAGFISSSLRSERGCLSCLVYFGLRRAFEWTPVDGWYSCFYGGSFKRVGGGREAVWSSRKMSRVE